MNYKENDLITIAKRENNSKRSFLLVNPLQGKHIPAVPSQCLELFSTLAKQVFSEQKFDYKVLTRNKNNYIVKSFICDENRIKTIF